MKKLLFLILLTSIAAVVKAQDKPTKSDTQGLINTTLKRVLARNSCSQGMMVSEQLFTNDFAQYHYAEKSKDKKKAIITDVSNIQWGNYLTCEMKTSSWDSGISCATVYFTTAMKETFMLEGKEVSTYKTIFDIVIQREKFESTKKAFERLVEIAKEEHKDPFKN